MTEKLFSFGIQENTDDAGKTESLSFSLCIFDKEEPIPGQNLVKVIEQIREKCKDFIMDNPEEIHRHDLDRAELKNDVSCLYWKKGEFTTRPQTISKRASSLCQVNLHGKQK